MSKIVLTDVSSGFQLSKINENFQKIEDELNNKVLYRDAPTGEPNALENDLDVNGKSLYNVGDISLLGHDGFEEILAETEAARDVAISAATDAQNEAISAAASAIASGASAGESSGFASNAEISALSAAASAIAAAAEVGALAVSSGAALVGFTQSGTGAVAQTVDSKLKQFVSVKDFGAVGDGVADDTAAIQDCCDIGGAYFIPFGSVIRLTAPINISAPVIFYGIGCVAFEDLNESAANVRGDGSWFHIDHTGKGFVIDGTNGSFDGVAPVRFLKCGTFRTQPTPGAGAFTPTDHNWDFDVIDCEVELDDFVALNPTRFFNASLARGGRVRLNNVRGQPLYRGIAIDNCYDVCHLDVHFWPYWSLNTNVAAYTKAQLQALVTGRVDGLLLQRFFTIYHNIGWVVANNGAGSVNRARGAWVYLDNGTRGIVVNAEADGSTIHIDELTAYGLSGSASYGMEISADNCHVTIGFADFESFYNQAMYIGGTGNRIQIDCPKFANYNYASAGPGIVNGAGNEIIFNGKVDHNPLASRYLFSGNGLVNAPDQWTTYTPAVTPSSGAITTLGTVSAKYRTVGDWVDVVFNIGVTTNGTGSGVLRMALPFTPADYAGGIGRETLATGNALTITAIPGNPLAQICTYNNLYPAGDGRAMIGSISYRKQ